MLLSDSDFESGQCTAVWQHVLFRGHVVNNYRARAITVNLFLCARYISIVYYISNSIPGLLLRPPTQLYQSRSFAHCLYGHVSLLTNEPFQFPSHIAYSTTPPPNSHAMGECLVIAKPRLRDNKKGPLPVDKNSKSRTEEELPLTPSRVPNINNCKGHHQRNDTPMPPTANHICPFVSDILQRTQLPSSSPLTLTLDIRMSCKEFSSQLLNVIRNCFDGGRLNGGEN